MDLLNPYLFTRDDLIKILSEKDLHINNLNKKKFSELLELYYNFIMPLHQRNTYRKGEMGIEITKNDNINLSNGSSNHRLKDKSCNYDKEVLKCNANGYKHKRIEFFNDDCWKMTKKRKLMDETQKETYNASITSPEVLLKRHAENIIDLPTKHKKITWP